MGLLICFPLWVLVICFQEDDGVNWVWLLQPHDIDMCRGKMTKVKLEDFVLKEHSVIGICLWSRERIDCKS